MHVLAVLIGLTAGVASQATSGNSKTTRYWDCCKPSCAWEGRGPVDHPVRACDANDSVVGPGTESGCDSNGGAYTCSDDQPWAVSDDLAYGFAATVLEGGKEPGWCCACYALKFTSGPISGKTMIVQSTNTGSDLGSSNHFDILIPGGGLGIFDGCTPQFGFQFPGERYGGTTSRDQCGRLPGSLQKGCDWRYDWFKDADNPDVTFRRVRCPDELVSRSGCRRNDDGDYASFDSPGRRRRR